MNTDLPPPRNHHVDDKSADSSVDEALAEVRLAKARQRTDSQVNRRTVAILAAVVTAMVMFGVAWLGGIAGAWVLFFVGVAGIPVTAVGWLVFALWDSWRQPLVAPETPDDGPAPD